MEGDAIWWASALLFTAFGYAAGAWQRADEVKLLRKLNDRLEDANDRLRDAMERALPKIPAWVQTRKSKGETATTILEQALEEDNADL